MDTRVAKWEEPLSEFWEILFCFFQTRRASWAHDQRLIREMLLWVFYDGFTDPIMSFCTRLLCYTLLDSSGMIHVQNVHGVLRWIPQRNMRGKRSLILNWNKLSSFSLLTLPLKDVYPRPFPDFSKVKCLDSFFWPSPNNDFKILKQNSHIPCYTQSAWSWTGSGMH